jgi:hypothetical protein
MASLVLRPAVSLVSVDIAGSSDRSARNAGSPASGWVRSYWRWKAPNRGGRPQVDTDLRTLIQQMSLENALWGAPRINGELLKLGFQVALSTVAKYMVKRYGRPPGQSWRTFN